MKELMITLEQTPNTSKLTGELRASLGALTNGVSTHGPKVRVHLDDAATASDEQTATTICQAHNSTVKTAAQLENEARQITREQVQAYLRRQLINPNPDTAAVKAQIEGVISGNTKLQTALDNVAALYGYDTGTTAGYLQAAIMALIILV